MFDVKSLILPVEVASDLPRDPRIFFNVTGFNINVLKAGILFQVQKLSMS